MIRTSTLSGSADAPGNYLGEVVTRELRESTRPTG